MMWSSARTTSRTAGSRSCVAEMAVHSGCGVDVVDVGGVSDAFDETPSRVVVCVAPSDEAEVEQRCEAAAVPLTWIGVGGGDRIHIGDVVDIPLSVAVDRWTRRLPAAFGTAVTH